MSSFLVRRTQSTLCNKFQSGASARVFLINGLPAFARSAWVWVFLCAVSFLSVIVGIFCCCLVQRASAASADPLRTNLGFTIWAKSAPHEACRLWPQGVLTSRHGLTSRLATTLASVMAMPHACCKKFSWWWWNADALFARIRNSHMLRTWIFVESKACHTY